MFTRDTTSEEYLNAAIDRLNTGRSVSNPALALAFFAEAEAIVEVARLSYSIQNPPYAILSAEVETAEGELMVNGADVHLDPEATYTGADIAELADMAEEFDTDVEEAEEEADWPYELESDDENLAEHGEVTRERLEAAAPDVFAAEVAKAKAGKAKGKGKGK